MTTTEDPTNIAHPYLRQVEVIIGPLPEYKGGGKESDGIRIFGDGSNDAFRIQFQINKPWLPSNVRIYNLSASLRNILHTEAAQMIVRAGWKNFDLIDIFRGSLLASFSNRQGADIITELIGFSGWYGKNRAVTSVTFAEGTQLKDAVMQLARQLEGVTVDSKRISLSPRGIQAGGRSFSEATNEALQKLSREYGFSWGIDLGVFYAIDDHLSFASNSVPVISGRNGYLLRSEPMLSSPIPAVTGVSVSSLFNPYVEVRGQFVLESIINPELNGTYVAHTVAHSGDTHSNQFNTEIQSWVVGGTLPVTRTEYKEWSDLELLAGTIYGEARGETTRGKQAVGLTIKTRATHPSWWGSGWRGVMLQKAQFTCWNDHNAAAIVAGKEANNHAWQDCYRVAQQIYSGQVVDVGLSLSPTHYCAKSIRPYWVKSLQFIETIGGHNFYHDPGLRG